uniref:Coiled-coil_56 domain-containing protein n=1 Tax=Trichuris muris TaxID=70415 RepID=A0A5S6QD10_TRIMR
MLKTLSKLRAGCISSSFARTSPSVRKNSKVSSNNEQIVEHLVNRMDENNYIRASRLQLNRRRSNLVGLLLGLLTVSIYIYTIHAVKEEHFLDDTNPPDNIN